MFITYSIDFAFGPESRPVVNARVLSILLENLIAIDRVYLISSAEVGHSVSSLHRSGVTYGRTRTWDSIPTVAAKGFGDCKSLSAWRIAELRNAGEVANPVFRWFKNRETGVRDFHILVQTAKSFGYPRSQEGFEDPSKDLGMNATNQTIER